MNLNIGRVLLLSAAATVAGAAVFAVYKSGGVKPAVTKVVKSGVKAGNWASKQYTSAKDEVGRLVDEAKSDMAG